jgi:hypothetical protein
MGMATGVEAGPSDLVAEDASTSMSSSSSSSVMWTTSGTTSGTAGGAGGAGAAGVNWATYAVALRRGIYSFDIKYYQSQYFMQYNRE